MSRLSVATRHRPQTRLHPAMKVVFTSFAAALMGVMLWNDLQHRHDLQQAHPRQGLFVLTLQDALAEARRSQRPCLVELHADFCYPCEQHVQTLTGHPALQDFLTRHYVLGQVECGSPEGRAWMQRYDVSTLPTLLLLDRDGRELDRYGLDASPGILLAALSRWTPGLERVTHLTETGPATSDRRFALQLASLPTYDAARARAEAQSRRWNRPLYIQTGSDGTYQLLMGAFLHRHEARIASRFLAAWEGQETQVVRIDNRPLQTE
ncbi:MAG: hypothetical protein OHK0039_31200 [Bacteroidia bacterium]